MNEYNFNVKFERGRISSNLKKLVQNDYNSTKINFTFDKEGRKLFKMLYPDGSAYITQIDNDELIFGPGVLSQDGTYEVEIALYTEDGRLTDYATTKFDVRAELIQSDEIVELDDRLPILDSLIGDVQGAKTEIEDAIQYATEQGDYAKEQANRNFDAIEEATKIVDNFEENVNEYKEDFDNNAILKTNDFNSNVDKKTTIFDNHVIDEINAFNTNATTKLNEYNTNSSSKLEEFNSNAAEKIEEYNANADNLISIAIDTRNELERVKNDILETGEASGNYLSLNDSTMAELQELEVNSTAKQLTTTGKNLLDINEGKVPIIRYRLPHTLSVGTYTISCKNTNTEMGFRLSNTTDTSTNSIANAGKKVIGNRQYLTLTTTFESNYINISCEGIEKIEEIMLELGDVPTEYEPYTGGTASPSPEYPQKIPVLTTESVLKSVGKNLFNENEYIENVQTSNFSEYNDRKCIQIYAKKHTMFKNFKPNTQYVISYEILQKSNTEIAGIVIHYDDGTEESDYTLNVGEKIFITKPNKNVSDIFFNGWSSGNYLMVANIQVIEGTQPTLFEPYQESILNLPIPEGEFVGYINDNIKDKLRVDYNEEDGNYHLYLDKMLGKVVLNGSEIWDADAGEIGTNYRHALRISKNDILTPSASQISVSTHFLCKAMLSAEFGHHYINTSHLVIQDKEGLYSLDEFKTWLNTHNTTIIYELLEPYTLDLGIVDMPISYDGVTNIFVDSDFLMNINTKYYRNFTETIRNLQINNDTLKNELASIESRLSALETSQASVVSESEVIE